MLRTTLLIALLLALLAPVAQAQEIFTYISHWRVPRAAFAAAAEFNEGSASGFEQLVADGTIVHWGIDEPFVHAPTGHTHGSWFAATSLEGIDKAMATLQGAGGDNPLASSSEAHHDHLLRSIAHGGSTANIRGGYSRTIIVRIKPGTGEDWATFAKAVYTSAFESLVEEGTVLLWEISADAIHGAGNSLNRYVWYVTADAAGVDRVNAALAKNRVERPGPTAALRRTQDQEGHRDGLARVDFQHK